MTKACAIYARISTQSQDPQLQLSDLRQYAEQHGLEIYQEYVDIGISGSIASRPQLNLLMDAARKRRIDVVLVWRFDRFARSSQHLVNALKEFKHLGVDFISFRENIDTSSPMGEAMFTVISAMTQLERDIISERIQAGMNKAKEKGVALGRPERPLDQDKILELKAKGYSIRQIAYELNIPKSTIHNFLLSQKPLQKELLFS